MTCVTRGLCCFYFHAEHFFDLALFAPAPIIYLTAHARSVD